MTRNDLRIFYAERARRVASLITSLEDELKNHAECVNDYRSCESLWMAIDDITLVQFELRKLTRTLFPLSLDHDDRFYAQEKGGQVDQ